MKWLYINKIGMKLFEVSPKWIKLFEITQNWIKMFHLARIWMKLLLFGQSWFSLLEFTQIFPIYGNSFYFTQIWMKLSNFTQNLNEAFCWPKFDEGCWNYHMIPVNSSQVLILPSGAKKNGKIVSDYLAVFVMILSLIWLHFAFVWKISTTSLTCECSCILCPNFENFCPNNGQFFSVGDATASSASPCHTLMTTSISLPN